MTENYTPLFVDEYLIRNMTTPPLDYSDVPEAMMLAHIEAVEEYVTSIFEINSKTDAKIPCTLLVLSRLMQSPNIAKKHYTMNSERLGDYSYYLKTSGSPYDVKSWERIALDILRAKSAVKDNKWRVYISNS